MRKLVGITALFAGLALLFSAGAMPAYADPGNSGNANAHGGNPNANANASGGNANAGGNANGGTSQAGDPNGANGTVKIHDWPEHKNGADMANDPKVCQFEIHGFKFDSGQTGRWWIQEHKWGNGDSSKAVLSGTYKADANGDWTSGPHKLADGHYKLFVEMTHRAGNSGNTVVTYKMKVFKVECAAPTPTPNNLGGGSTPTPTPTPTPVVGGFESNPTTTPVTTIEAGSESPGQSVLAGLGSLPSTSTGAAGLGLIGLAITGLGLALLRRQPK